MIWNQRLLHGIDASAEAGLVTRGRVLMQPAFLDSLVQHRDGRAIQLLCRRLVALGDGFAELAQRGAQARRVRAIADSAAFSLAGAFKRRKMICHVWFVTFVCIARYSGGLPIFYYRGASFGRSNQEKALAPQNC